MVSASLYFNYSMFDLQRPIPVLSLFRHFQCNHGDSDPGPHGMDLSFCDQTAGGGPMLSEIHNAIS